MKTPINYFIVLFSLALSFLAIPKAEAQVRIGWQKPWATQGQLAQILMATDILKANKIPEAKFVSMQSGPELNELAIGGQLDVLFTGDLPGIMLHSKNSNWIAIGRLMYNRTVTYIPLNSKISKLADLKGKKIGLPLGAAAQKILEAGLIESQLDPKKDVQFINLQMTEHAPLIEKHKNDPTWGDFAALSGFDPIPAMLEIKGQVKPLHVGKVVAVVMAHKDFLKANPKFRENFLKSLTQAYEHFKSNRTDVDEAYSKSFALPMPIEALKLAASVEPNLTNPIRVSFNEDDLTSLKATAEFINQKNKFKFSIENFIARD